MQIMVNRNTMKQVDVLPSKNQALCQLRKPLPMLINFYSIYCIE